MYIKELKSQGSDVSSINKVVLGEKTETFR